MAFTLSKGENDLLEDKLENDEIIGAIHHKFYWYREQLSEKDTIIENQKLAMEKVQAKSAADKFEADKIIEALDTKLSKLRQQLFEKDVGIKIQSESELPIADVSCSNFEAEKIIEDLDNKISLLRQQLSKSNQVIERQDELIIRLQEEIDTNK